MRGREGAGAAEAVDGFPNGTCSGCCEFGGVHRAAAADADHAVGSGLPDQTDHSFNARKLGVFLHTGENGTDRADSGGKGFQPAL